MDLAVAALIAGASIAFAAVLSTKQRRKRLAIFEGVAKKLDGRVEAGGFFDGPTLTVESGGARITVETWSNKNASWTRWVAYANRHPATAFTVAPATFVSSFTAAMGAQDITVGVDDFDKHFQVRGTDPQLVRRLWTPERARTMLAIYRDCEVEGSYAHVKLLRPKAVENEADVETGIDFVLDLAKGDVFGMGALAMLPDSTLYKDVLPYVVISGPGSIRVGPVSSGGKTVTAAKASVVMEDLMFEVSDGEALESDLAKLPEAARPHVKRLGRARITSKDGEVTIRWFEIEIESARLTAAIDLLRALTKAPSLGVFR